MTEYGQTGRYELLYEDGSTAVLPVTVYGNATSAGVAEAQRLSAANIADWWPTAPQFSNDKVRQVPVMDPGGAPASLRFLYAVQWDNPQPDKVIKALRLTSDPQKNATVIVVAVTLME